ncbi:GNAT domain-containing protein [Entophlyctis helioformis]|nr:GNAT domain-containing protein [Entophlyctis helioformis]
MLANERTALLSKDTALVLVPYRPDHVPAYHEWMKSPYLQDMTASEPLTLDEEYEMCESWRIDDKKCTFILLSRDMPKNRVGPLADVAGMIGDVNLFFNDHDDAGSAEVELMIAEPDARRKGHGKKAALLMMEYGIKNLGVTKYTTKISLRNEPSIALFESLGFVKESVSEIFQEVTMECLLDDERRLWIASQAGAYETVSV